MTTKKKTRKRRKRKDDHVTMGGAGLRCQHCGTERELPYSSGGDSVMVKGQDGKYVSAWRGSHGLAIPVMEAYGKDFSRHHIDCKADDPRGKARYDYGSPAEWIGSWDTGVSALAIYGTFMDKSLGQLMRGRAPMDDPIPYDPADFGRCYRLLNVAPITWRGRLPMVAQRYQCWRPYVAAWGKLEKLYEEELPSGEAPKTYEMLQKIRANQEARA